MNNNNAWCFCSYLPPFLTEGRQILLLRPVWRISHKHNVCQDCPGAGPDRVSESGAGVPNRDSLGSATDATSRISAGDLQPEGSFCLAHAIPIARRMADEYSMIGGSNP